MALEPSVDLKETSKRSLTAKMENSVRESIRLIERVRHSMAHSKEMLARSHDQMRKWRDGVIWRSDGRDS